MLKIQQEREGGRWKLQESVLHTNDDDVVEEVLEA